MKQSEKVEPYVMFMLVLSILSLVALAFSTAGHLDPDQQTILAIADHVVCGVFFVDFLVLLYRAPNRWKYFLRWGWLDLLSSVPMIDAFRSTRLARIFRILRLLRGIKATRILAQFILDRRAQSAFIAVVLVSLLLVVVSSILILQFEVEPGSNIKSGEDAIWWAVATITTVGYGDRFPVTSEGRLISSVLMVCGVGLFGTLSGFVASWFLKPQEAAQDLEMKVMLAEIREVKALLQAQANEKATSPESQPEDPVRGPRSRRWE